MNLIRKHWFGLRKVSVGIAVNYFGIIKMIDLFKDDQMRFLFEKRQLGPTDNSH
jgi:hypothetical protein